MIPQIIYLVLLAIGFGFAAKEKGNKTTDNIFTGLVTTALTQGLYYWGGFWDTFSWPQITMALLALVLLGLESFQHGKERTKKGLSLPILIGTFVYNVLLYYGGFFNPLIELVKQ